MVKIGRTLLRAGGVTVGGALAGLAAFGVTSAATQDADVINGCYGATGVLRVIDPATSECFSSEQAIQWNKQGPQGIPGPKGDTGAQGDPGVQGPKGDPGLLTGYEQVYASFDLPPSLGKLYNHECPAGKRVLSGSASNGVGESRVRIDETHPYDFVQDGVRHSGQFFAVTNTDSVQTVRFGMVVICAQAS